MYACYMCIIIDVVDPCTGLVILLRVVFVDKLHAIARFNIMLYPGVGANYGWIKGKSVLTFVM